MSEPSETVYEAARVAYDGVVISRGAFGYRAGHYDAIRAAVDAVWPLAVAEGRRQAAEAILTKGREFHPATLRAQLLEAAARIAARPPVTFVHPCGYSQISPIPHLCPQCGTAEPWS